MTSPPHYRDGKWDAAPRITLERDPFDRLVKACADSDQYPARHTLLAIKLSRYVTKKYQIYLEDQDEVLFHKRKSQMVFWELWNSDNSKSTPRRRYPFHLESGSECIQDTSNRRFQI